MKLLTPGKSTKPQSPPKPSRSEALACVPVIMPQAQWVKQENGDILVEYPFVAKPLLQAIFNRFNGANQQKLTRKLQLDGLGSQVWAAIDGEKSVAELIRDFAESSTMSMQEAELSVTTFLRELGKRGLILLR